EDGIRDKLVTGVQTCALPIYQHQRNRAANVTGSVARTPNSRLESKRVTAKAPIMPKPTPVDASVSPWRSTMRRTSPRPAPKAMRSEERRVGKECRSWVAG